MILKYKFLYLFSTHLSELSEFFKKKSSDVNVKTTTFHFYSTLATALPFFSQAFTLESTSSD